MFEKRRMATMVLPVILLTQTANAEDFDWFSDDSWYASFRAGYLSTISSDGKFNGPTQSVYGGSPKIEMDDGFQYTFALGRDLFEDLRLELQLSFINSQTDSTTVQGTDLRLDDTFGLQADVDSTLLMANIGYDFNYLNWWATPYVRGGIGVAENETNASLSVDFNSAIWQGTSFEGQSMSNQAFAEGSSTEFAWNVAAGFKKNLADRWALRLEYSLLNRGEAWTGMNETDDAVMFSELESQQVMLGVDWLFQ